MCDAVRTMHTEYGRASTVRPGGITINVYETPHDLFGMVYDTANIYDPDAPLRTDHTYRVAILRCLHCNTLVGWRNRSTHNAFDVIL